MASASRLFVLYLVTVLLVQIYVEGAEPELEASTVDIYVEGAEPDLDVGASTADIYAEGADLEPGTLTADLNKKGDGKGIDCKAACTTRCQKASRHKICLRACHTCCQRCNCVPPGTSGNEDVCTCYANMRTHHNRHKCP